MTGRARTLAIMLGAGAAVAAVARHLVGHRLAAERGRHAPGGILIPDTASYDSLSALFLGSFFDGIAADVAAVAPEGAGILEVGCGPGHLSVRLARQHDFDVTGIDLDPVMIERARANAGHSRDADGRTLAFLAADVASLPFPDGSFDLVVSTLSMHHWDDPTAGLAEIGRVLRPAGRGLVWDLRPGGIPFHAPPPDPTEHVRGSPLRVASATPWRWPWRFALTQRIELLRR